MSIRTALAAVLVGFGAWFATRQTADAGPVYQPEPLPEPTPEPMPEQSGPPPELIPAPAPVAPGGVAGLVATINQAEFGGWFAVPDVLGVIEIESGFNPRATNPSDPSYGLMALMPSTAADRGYSGPVEGLYDPETNIRLGMRQLKWSWDYLNRKRGVSPSPAEWIGSYNAGVGNVLKGFIPWGYVQKWQAARAKWGG